jgi:S-adenosylmethionine:tRNA ribosyltransferase-isomerase
MLSDPPAEATHPSGREWRVEDFNYDLPRNAIAQVPLPERSGSRLMVVRRSTRGFEHSTIRDLGRWLRPGDLLVANNSQVLPARLEATREGTGGRVELLLLRQEQDNRWIALAKPARRLREGTRLVVSPRNPSDQAEVVIEIEAVGTEGKVRLRLPDDGDFDLGVYGQLPLPPYIVAPLHEPARYQTVYAKAGGSAAAPTAGLHFTPTLIEDLGAAGIGWAEITLHVGLDTFRPVAVERIAEHTIHREWFEVPEGAAEAIAATKQAGGRIIAVGTTTARTLEFVAQQGDAGQPRRTAGMADLFITPGYRWRLVDGLLTNFHLPRSTLLMMVSALAGVETIRAAYAEAVAEGYRFYSFGDAMVILPTER